MGDALSLGALFEGGLVKKKFGFSNLVISCNKISAFLIGHQLQ